MKSINPDRGSMSWTLFRRWLAIAVTLFAASAVSSCSDMPSAGSARGVQRMYVLYCGELKVPDIAPWTAGAHAGEPRTFSDNCYLIKHASGWMLWDSGLSDTLLDKTANGPRGMQMSRSKTLVGQLADLGVSPEQVKLLAFSHSHQDHIGNANLFSHATVYVQSTEYAAMFGPTPEKFGFAPATYQNLKANTIKQIDGDYDVFGDGSVEILSTPGHTPGHQSLLVQLPHTGAIILSGDVAHFQENFDLRRVPAFNYNIDQSKQSMDKLAAVMQKEHAQLWINHDAEQNATIKHAPEFYD
jgi:N-acyl homoserine lactone hydrolase